MLSVAHRKGGAIRLKGIDAGGEPVTFGLDDIAEPPEPGRPHRRARAVPARTTGPSSTRWPTRCGGPGSRRPDAEPSGDDGRRRRAGPTPVEAHPVARLPRPRPATCGRDAHAERAQRELADMRREVRSRTGSLARRFDRVLRLLEAWGYLDGWALTERGEVLARTYHEGDLLVAEAMTAGLLDGLDPASLAGLRLVLHLRAPRAGRARRPPGSRRREVRARWAELERLAADLRADEEAGRPAADPRARPGVRGPGPRVGGGRAAGRGARATRTSRAATSSATSRR